MEDLLENLNNSQVKAVKHKKGPLLIIAGAGTGKTTVITRRIAYIISNKLAKPSEILALTFTDKAADEMESRVDLLVPYGYIDVTISTFHAFGDRILRDYAIDLKMRPDYRVLSKAEQIVFFRENLHLFPLDYYKSLSDPMKNIEAIITAISRAKDEDISPEEYVKWSKKAYSLDKSEENKKNLEIANIYKKYEELKIEKGFIDFGDQVNMVLKLFRSHKSILKKFQEKYKYVLVDEFQDTNYAQFELIRLLSGKYKNITVVGDDDQSIYKFRGAAISNILNFEKNYKKCSKIVLNENYRSTQLILDSSYRLIRHNDPERLEVLGNINKKLVSRSDAEIKKVEHRHFDFVLSEADWVARMIKDKFSSGEYKLKDFVILVRSKAEAKPFLQSLNLLSLPYVFSGGGGLYNFPEVRLALSFLKVIGDLSDNLSLYELSMAPVYMVDPLDIQKINTFAKRRNFTIHYVFAHLEEAKSGGSEFSVLADLREDTFVSVKKIMSDIEYYLDFSKKHSTGEVLYEFLKKSGYLIKLTKEESEENENKIKNLSKFFEKVREFGEISKNDKVSEFVKYLEFMKDAGENPEISQGDEDFDAVNVLTVHKAKGLEFPVVFLVALVSDKFPTRIRREPIELPDKIIKEKIPKSEFHIQEERRLFYVAMTRAKNELYLTSSASYGGKRERKISQFVLEALDMPKALITTEKKSPIEQIELFAPAESIIFPSKKIGENETISLSFYPIDDYITCPMKYKYVHILNIPLLQSHTIMYGSAMHKAVQAFYTAKLNGQKFLEKDLIDVLLNNWSSQGFISREHEEARLKKGREALKRFYKEEKKSPLFPLFVEKEFKILKDDIQIRGRFDLVLESKDKKNYIVDFKSTEVKEKKDADKKASDSIQLSIYAMAWLEKYGKVPDVLRLYFMDNGINGDTYKSEKDLVKIWEKIRLVADSIRRGDFRPNPSSFKCGYCPYNDICPSSAV